MNNKLLDENDIYYKYAIGVSRTACNDGFRQNRRSHSSWSVLLIFILHSGDLELQNPLSILIPSDFPQNGFPVVKALTSPTVIQKITFLSPIKCY